MTVICDACARRSPLIRNSAINAIARFFPEGTRVAQPPGGVVLWVELPRNVDGAELFRTALRAASASRPAWCSRPRPTIAITSVSAAACRGRRRWNARSRSSVGWLPAWPELSDRALALVTPPLQRTGCRRTDRSARRRSPAPRRHPATARSALRRAAEPAAVHAPGEPTEQTAVDQQRCDDCDESFHDCLLHALANHCRRSGSR